MFGNGITKDMKEATKYFKISSDKGGNDKSMYLYALMCNAGDGVTLNRKEAAKYFKIAVEKGNE